MKIVVIGLGSMGKRRIRILKELGGNISIIGVESNKERAQKVSELFDIPIYDSIEDAKKSEKIDHAFVCTSPLSHNSIIHESLMNGWNVFTELNLVDDGYKENMELAKKNNCVLFLSSTFLYREEIKHIRKKLENRGNINYVYHIGQYLPDWHPWEDYKNFFVGDKRTNGCREIMAIELPWLISIFGNIINYRVMADNMSDLDLPYRDNYFIECQHEKGNKGMLIVDVVCPKAVRNLEIYGERMYIHWDGTPTGLMYYDCEKHKDISVKLYDEIEQIEGYSSFVVENAYRSEIQEFFKVVNREKKQLYGFEEDIEILHLIDKMESSHI